MSCQPTGLGLKVHSLPVLLEFIQAKQERRSVSVNSVHISTVVKICEAGSWSNILLARAVGSRVGLEAAMAYRFYLS